MSAITFEKCNSCGTERPIVSYRQHAERCETHRGYASFPNDCDGCRSAAGLQSYLDEEIEKLRAQAARCEAEAKRIADRRDRYPDLKKRIGRWNKFAFYSKAANTQVDRFDIRHNCGCCPDSPLEIWPYVEIDKVYSDPPCFVVGEKDRFGDRPRDGWDEEMRAAGIPEPIIGAVSMHFNKRRDAMRAEADSLRDRADNE